ncbi:hypothetical protein [Allochromatium vinosum]|uniref:hypothetical protein n=1 Tax=Allochromatium vinosum TaxID=1049 RepID=UPI0019064BDC|nr:hypothetical protein [Allochromatium vinosum]MBK1653361.1 hypothetical protein [Allochromatium vinosum]
MSVHHIETYRPGYYAELEAFRTWLLQQNAHHARIQALTVDVAVRYPGIPTKYLPAMLASMGRHQDASEVAASIAFIAAETEDELKPDAIEAAAWALLTAHLPNIARIAKEYAR